MRDFVSFVVDGIDHHYFQAELLLFSLSHFARHPKENILVQCTNRVDGVFLNFLQDDGYKFKIIEPFLDGKYCNKVKQLEAFENIEPCNVFFLDVDTFVLEPLSVPERDYFCAKTVDAPNPPLHILVAIFESAEIKLPKIIETDWVLDNAKTISSNFNGGFYYVPRHMLGVVGAAWKKWATWLYQRPELFESKEQAIHTDQVSMALAICDSGVNYRIITSNYNCPTHQSHKQRSFLSNNPILLLHYHRGINVFGFLQSSNASNDDINEAIKKANSALASYGKFRFYARYRRGLVSPIKNSHVIDYLEKAIHELKADRINPLKIILHAGTPKTGTTSMQFFMADQRDELRKKGICYPTNISQTYAPKHQWLVTALIRCDVQFLIDQIREIFLQIDEQVTTVLLSTEGLYNHWFDFSQDAKSLLKVIASNFDVEVWVWFRSYLAFIKSYYKQNLKNPRMGGVSCYGRDLSLAEMLEDQWFANHLDYLGFIYEMEVIFGKSGVKVSAHKDDAIYELCTRLGIECGGDFNAGRENIGFGDAAIDLLRIVNRYPVNPSQKAQIVDALKAIDLILKPYCKDKSYDNETKTIESLVSLQKSVLAIEYGLDFFDN